jgi:hypothetical protein
MNCCIVSEPVRNKKRATFSAIEGNQDELNDMVIDAGVQHRGGHRHGGRIGRPEAGGYRRSYG